MSNDTIKAAHKLLNDAAVQSESRKRDEEIRAKARHQFAADDCQIDANAAISYMDGGAWVSAWVWVSRDDK